MSTQAEMAAQLMAVGGQVPVVRESVPGEHMPTQPTFRVVVPRFPRAAAVVRWVSTVGAAGVVVGCFATAAVLGVAAGLGVWS